MQTSRSSGRLGTRPRQTPQVEQTQSQPRPQPKPKPQQRPPQQPLKRITTPQQREYTEQKRQSANLVRNTEALKEKKKEIHKPAKKKKILIPIIMAIILFIGAGGGIYWYMQQNAKPTLETIRPQIAELYVDNQKSELKQTTTEESVNQLLAEVDKIEVKESEVADKDGFTNELKSINAYLSDKKLIAKMTDAEYDLDDKDYIANINALQASINDYKVAGLRVSNMEAVKALGDEQQSYKNIKQQLIGVASDTEADANEYMADIDAKIKHNPNKEKLTQVITYIGEKQTLTREIKELEKDAKKNKKEIDAKTKDKGAVQEKIMGILMPKETE